MDLCGIFLFLITSLPPSSRVAPSVTDGGTLYARPGETVTFPCRVPHRVTRPITSPVGLWKWSPRASGPGAAVTILQYLSNVRSKSTAELSGRSRLAGNRQYGDFALVVSGLARSDSGSYSCEFSFGGSQARATWQLQVIQVTATAPNPLIETQRVELKCEGMGPNVSWSGPLGPAGQGGTLTLIDLGVQHDGNWICTAWVGGRNVQSNYRLKVIGLTDPPDQRLFFPAPSASLLPCHLNHAPPSLAAAWYLNSQKLVTLNASRAWISPRDQRVLAMGPQPVTNLSVGLRVETLAHGGVFECRVTLGVVILRRTVRVTVIKVGGREPVPVPAGTNATLLCNLSDHDTQTEIRWARANGTVQAEVARVRGEGSLHLALTEVTQLHAGDWICEACHGQGVCGRGTYSLTVSAQPLMEDGDPPLVLIIAVSVGAFGLLLLVTVSAAGLSRRVRRRRRALKRLRHPLCREHSHQLSNQPLCHSNDYTPGDRPLPPPPVPYCPHRQPRKGRPSQGRGSRHARTSQFGP